MIKRRFLWVGLFSLLSLFISAQLFAQADVIKERRNLMKANSKATKAIKKAAKTSDFATIETKAKEIAASMNELVDLFPKGSTSGKSRAKAVIWEKMDTFNEKRIATKAAADALAKAAADKNENEVKVQVKALGTSGSGACGSCHKPFRKAKKRTKKKK